MLSSVRQMGSDSPQNVEGEMDDVVQARGRQARSGEGASQNEFVLMIGVSLATLQNWEQGRRTPDGRPSRSFVLPSGTRVPLLKRCTARDAGSHRTVFFDDSAA
jgi:hypothetical protein